MIAIVTEIENRYMMAYIEVELMCNGNKREYKIKLPHRRENVRFVKYYCLYVNKRCLDPRCGCLRNAKQFLPNKLYLWQHSFFGVIRLIS